VWVNWDGEGLGRFIVGSVRNGKGGKKEKRGWWVFGM